MILKVENLEKEINKQKIYSSVSFEIQKKETLLIVGENGTGKSIFLKTLLGIFVPTNGNIEFKKKIKIDSYLNNYLLHSELSVIRNIYLYSLLKNGKIEKNRINYLLEVFGLSKLKTKRTNIISDGEKQRSSLLISMINYDKLDILILDEPFNFIDNDFNKKIIKFIYNLKCAKIIATHNTELFNIHTKKIIFGNY